MSKRVAYLGKAYHGTAGGNPTNLITGLVSVSPDFSAGEISANDRDNPDWEVVLRGRKSGSIDLELNYDSAGSAFQTALENAFDATDPASQLIALKFLSDATDAKGYYADFRVMNLSRQEPGDGLMTLTVGLRYWTGFTRV